MVGRREVRSARMDVEIYRGVWRGFAEPPEHHYSTSTSEHSCDAPHFYVLFPFLGFSSYDLIYSRCLLLCTDSGIVCWSLGMEKVSDPAAVSIEYFIQNPVKFVPTISSAQDLRTAHALAMLTLGAVAHSSLYIPQFHQRLSTNRPLEGPAISSPYRTSRI